MKHRIITGDCIAAMQAGKADAIDAIVTDPPYGIEFMGEGWDNPRMLGQIDSKNGGAMGHYPKGTKRPGYNDCDGAKFSAWCEAWGAEALRVLKPGGHAVVFGGTRMWHRLTVGLEDAGFEVRDCLMWLHADGMPKGRNVGKQIDKAQGTPGPIVGETDEQGMSRWNGYRHGKYDESTGAREVRGPGSEQAAQWWGWSTTLKPCVEPILLLRKPMTKPAVHSVLEHGVGALNIPGCMVDGDILRWPANVVIDDGAAEMLGDNARFYFHAKASAKEKRAGLDREHAKHPTVKPLALMQWLARLVCPPGGLILDPFMGSGSTGVACVREGFNFVGMELDADYARAAQARIQHAIEQSAVPA